MKKLNFLAFYLAMLPLFFCSCVSKEEDPAPVALSENNLNAEVMLTLVNEWRAKGCDCGGETMPPVTPLSWNSLLEQAALDHSKDMGANDLFSHIGSNGSSPGDRLLTAGYDWSSYGENIAAGTIYPDEAKVVQGWIDSPGHCKNIMKSDVIELGVALAKVDQNHQFYWTMLVGLPR